MLFFLLLFLCRLAAKTAAVGSYLLTVDASAELRFNRARDTEFTGQSTQPLTLAGDFTGGRVDGQNDDLSSLTRQLTALSERLQEAETNHAAPANERPPHY